ncbi:hypothetical protein [Pleurochrysis sp. Polinton-like virus]|nr:hypothetical protein [Pleurochrysis sp. Polinton-like virus]
MEDTKQLTKAEMWRINNEDRVKETQRGHCLKQAYDRVSFPCRASIVKYGFTREEMQGLLDYIMETLQTKKIVG